MLRVSSRLREIPEDKRPYYGNDRRRRRSGDSGEEEADRTTKKKKKNEVKNLKNQQRKSSPETETETETGTETVVALAGTEHCAPLVDQNGTDLVRRVKETLRLFNLYYLRFVKEENQRCDKPQESEAGNSPSTKKRSRRPDLKAMEKMRNDKMLLHPKRILGSVPGVKVGFQFFSRTEMVAVGMHAHWLSGIDCISDPTQMGKENIGNGYSFPLATAIVLSGQYQDDVDNSEEILYTGQGGNDLLGNKQQIKDQTLTRGNLGLKNCIEHSTPVRVIRGHKYGYGCAKKVVYTYDGLYKVVDYWPEVGVAGFIVFKFKLKRFPGQPELVTNEVCYVRGKGSKPHSEIPGLVCKDLSNGLEDLPVPVTNIIDDPPVGPEGFTYIKSIETASDIKIPPNAHGCKCKGKCVDPEICACAKLNCSDFPYVHLDGGRLIEPKDIVFECGPNCGCGSDCVNRTSQQGLKYKLEIYRTYDKGWAVRSWDYIPSGAPVCEYIGVLKKSAEMNNVTTDEYIFEIDCLQTINGIGTRERRLGDVALPDSHIVETSGRISDVTPEFCLDSVSKGNVARFINHSCEPNLFVQCILSSHHDITLARIVLFAADTISPLQELTYDYGYELDSVVGSDGKIKILPCYCGATSCRGRLY